MGLLFVKIYTGQLGTFPVALKSVYYRYQLFIYGGNTVAPRVFKHLPLTYESLLCCVMCILSIATITLKWRCHCTCSVLIETRSVHVFGVRVSKIKYLYGLSKADPFKQVFKNARFIQGGTDIKAADVRYVEWCPISYYLNIELFLINSRHI